jgi:hypothetical protein
VIWVAEQFAILAEQSEIDAPGVDTDAVQPQSRLGRRGLAQAGLQLFPLAEQVPVEMSVELAVGVEEAVLFFERELLPAEPPQHRPTALGPQIKRQEILRRHHSSSRPPGYAGRSAGMVSSRGMRHQLPGGGQTFI